MTDNLKKLPEKLEETIYICLRTQGCLAGEFAISNLDVSKYSEGDILITSKKVTFNIPQNIDVKGKVIESLESEKDKIQADFHMSMKKVQDKIDSLLSIEHQQ